MKYQFDIAMVKLTDRISDPVPHPSDVLYDTIRPICLPDPEILDIPVNEVALNSRFLTTKQARIMSYPECRDWKDKSLAKKGLTPQVYVTNHDFPIVQLTASSELSSAPGQHQVPL